MCDSGNSRTSRGVGTAAAVAVVPQLWNRDYNRGLLMTSDFASDAGCLSTFILHMQTQLSLLPGLLVNFQLFMSYWCLLCIWLMLTWLLTYEPACMLLCSCQSMPLFH